jgi:DNA-binding MarR family transcriptional regulator
MKDKEASQERNLTSKQLDVLRLLFRFRFGTSDLISVAQGKLTRQAANARLSSLAERGYISGRRDGKDRVQGKPTIYSLAAKGRAVLRKEPGKYSESALDSIRANRDSSDRFIEHNLLVFAIFNSLSELYGDKLEFLTKSNLAAEEFDYLTDLKPDAFVQLDAGEGEAFLLYLLDDNTPDFALIRRVSAVFEYEKSGKWQAKTGKELPRILLVCTSNKLRTTMAKRFERLVMKESSGLLVVTTLLIDVLEGRFLLKSIH